MDREAVQVRVMVAIRRHLEGLEEMAVVRQIDGVINGFVHGTDLLFYDMDGRVITIVRLEVSSGWEEVTYTVSAFGATLRGNSADDLIRAVEAIAQDWVEGDDE